ncbi:MULTISPECIES: CDP-alcohol phosphatidyltransferase family protein [unclassified Leeuwenhoekiella]|uniref:CDP-alcohol phosphatidyltransferase family protein n=1 Tax=unclassified Leeuwenhoekiella TaxID=2615029 RepID=UPI000C359EFB|nr:MULTISPECIES: CDP-alcohol phosphatidyltransferase family protein [unclassified Leeuwenhoekiella]MAW96166.1 CDP-alcohol phosphatidyltransferase [Leeuwenhoekiella sp.]MBA80160.1 CDP-alcohol phosphatidyltransferase [Leeuwenhoekiella sp.]|tara:strand:+ start:10347 stop:11126 length:780 start_codon:yes stop_codon:yes gene_type:complete
MSKLPPQYAFTDLSDYGRTAGRSIASRFKNTSCTPIHLTTAFIVAGLLAVTCIGYGHYKSAALLLILKSVIDAADGELARLKNTPSYTGRYYDSVADIILNFIILTVIALSTETALWLAFLAFIGLQLQGTLYNYYYVILRNRHNGDTTSRIFENTRPLALAGESQITVNAMYFLYTLLYSSFDKIIYRLDPNAVKIDHLPGWFMTLVSVFGLGFQLLLISILLATGLEDFIIPVLLGMTVLIPVFIGLRKVIKSLELY